MGGVALGGGTLAGWLDPRLLRAVLEPPPVARGALALAAAIVALLLLGRAIERLGTAAGPRGTIRGVRLAFLAVAALAAAAGWLLGQPLPIVVALVVAGVDVLETTFLLLATGQSQR